VVEILVNEEVRVRRRTVSHEAKCESSAWKESEKIQRVVEGVRGGRGGRGVSADP
jgi:hypothetical protein